MNGIYRGFLGAALVALIAFGFVGMSVASTPSPLQTGPKARPTPTNNSCKKPDQVCSDNQPCCPNLSCVASELGQSRCQVIVL